MMIDLYKILKDDILENKAKYLSVSDINSNVYAAIKFRPSGRVITEEQFEYVLAYVKYTNEVLGIYNWHLTFAEKKYKYINLRNGGGQWGWYLSFDDKPEDAEHENFSYGLAGKLEFL